MCPDESLLSAYVDGEVPSPWKEKLESHVVECPKCADRVSGFRELDARLQQLTSPDAEHKLAMARARIQADLRFDIVDAEKSKLVSVLPQTFATEHLDTRYKRKARRNGSRRAGISMPVLAASVLVLIFAAGLVVGGKVLVNKKPQSIASASGTIQVGSGSMDSINQYWSSLKSDQGVTITMPSEISFEPIGDPVIMTYSDGAAAATVVSPVSSGTSTSSFGSAAPMQTSTP
ncbi:MAG TPA: zf-HC2 domain-containing protein [Spirochaetales bacterium]|nr:zf-HC2 domain-containing protein [Spirochaetales bacterium]